MPQGFQRIARHEVDSESYVCKKLYGEARKKRRKSGPSPVTNLPFSLHQSSFLLFHDILYNATQCLMPWWLLSNTDKMSAITLTSEVITQLMWVLTWKSCLRDDRMAFSSSSSFIQRNASVHFITLITRDVDFMTPIESEV